MLPIWCDSEHGESSKNRSNRASMGEHCWMVLSISPSSNPLISFFFSGLICLLITLCLLSYSDFTHIDADPHTLPCLSLPLLIFWLSVPCLSVSLSVSVTAFLPVSLFLASVWHRITQERSKQGNDCLFPFLLPPAPVLTLRMIEVIIRRLYLLSPLLIGLWRKIWRGWEASENEIVY